MKNVIIEIPFTQTFAICNRFEITINLIDSSLRSIQFCSVYNDITTVDAKYLNVSKCTWMMFGTAQRLRCTQLTDLFIGENPLEKVQNYKYLGMWLDINLDWHYHIDVMRSTISRRIGVLKRVRSYLTEDFTTKLHNAMVLPLFDYCDTIYGTNDHLALSKLQRLQNRDAKTILRVPKDTPTQIVLIDLKWLPLTKRITYHTHILMFKCLLNGLAPNFLSRNVKYVNHCYNK